MKATITYTLSEIGRKASLIAGGDGREKQTVDAEVDVSALDVLTVKNDGGVVGDASQKPGDYGTNYFDFDSVQTVESLIANMRLWRGEANARAANIKKRDEDKRRADAESIETAKNRFLADPDARLDGARDFDQGRSVVYVRLYESPCFDMRADHPVAVEAVRRYREDRATRQRVEAEARAERERVEAEKQAFFLSWIAEHGTDNQRERHAEQLLSEQDIKTAIRDHVFAPVDAEQYVKINHRDCCTDDCDGCYEDCKMDCSITGAISSLSAEQWESVKRVRAIVSTALPDAATKIRHHVCTVPCCDGEAQRMGLLVTVARGGMEFNREFAI